MSDMNDMDSIQEYADHGSEAAFAELVHRHINLVYSVALRFTGNPQDAQDVTQAVFIILAQKAASLRQRTTLTGWLYETTRFTARQVLRTRARRQAREQEHYMESILNDADTDNTWRQLAPLLEEAMAQLSERERTLIALRFFERKSAVETAALLGIQEPAARKRAERAVEKLRSFFTKRGVTLTAAALTVAISANSVQAAPATLAKSVITVAIAKGAAASASTSILVQGALKLLAWAKVQTAIVVGTAVILAAGTTAVVVTGLDQRQAPVAGEKLSPEDAWFAGESPDLGFAPPALFVRTTRFPMKTGESWWEGGGDFVLVHSAGRNVNITNVLTAAYNFKPTRMILPPGLPATHFDFLSTLPHSPPEVFQNTIKDTLGWTAHTEMRETNVLLLEVKTANAPGLHISATTNYVGRLNYGLNWYLYQATNVPISDLREYLEDEVLHQPVIDQTGLTNKYDINLDGNAPRYQDMEPSYALFDQLGLVLVPDRKRIEMLVVERAKK